MIRNYITATDLMNYLYDPRIIYYVHVLKIPQATTPKEIAGRKKYEAFAQKSKRNKIIKELPKLAKKYDIFMASNAIGASTKLDCVAIDETKREAYPIQVKYSVKPRALYRTQKFQIVLEAMLIEERLGWRVPCGYVKFLRSGDFIKVAITDTLKAELLEILSEIRDIIENERLPRATAHKKKRVDNVYKNIY